MVSKATNNIGGEILEQSIPERFQTQVLQHGSRPAIIFQGRSLTYNELNRWSNQIARAILDRRDTVAEPIALLFATEPAMIAAMLGVLKAGKFYVPLDISLPESRLSLILKDSKAKLILSHRHHLQASGFEQSILSQDVLRIDTLDKGISDENLEIQCHPDDLAYILYTSGSTSRPKGVMQNHRYVLNLYRNYSNSGKMSEGDLRKQIWCFTPDRFSLLYSAAFGGAVRDIYCALLNGATLLPLDVKQISLHKLAGWLQDNEITVTFMVATLFRHFAATLNEEADFPKLRLIQIGSETVYRQDAELFQRHFSPQCTLMVNLGGTEISPVRQFPITKDTVLTGSTVPAGYGVPGTEVLLWDESGQEVPPGEVGEIVVCSRQLALGYWQQPGLTKRVFVENQKHKCFKTGDLGKLLPDGCLLHLGRKDFQVKIRGYRVETSEVEATLLNLEAVGEAVVVAQTEKGGAVGDRLLVAYLTAVNSENKLTAQELKAALGDKLPSYMIPACFIWLESLPLTATGKIDRLALPKPESILSSSELELNVIAPRTNIEETLVKIWSEVLKIEPIGIENNFFELGGHSLHASQVLARIAEKLGIEMPLKQIFEAPTISLLSKYIESLNTSTSEYPLAPTPTERGADIPLSLTQQGLWFLAQLEENRAAYNLVRAFVLTGSLDRKSLEKAIATLIDRHEILRTTFETREGMPFQVIAPHIPLPLSVVDLTTEGKDVLEKVILQEQNRPFNLTHGPLLRFTLICLAQEKQILLLTMHHIISDDWSIQVLLRELSCFYTAGLTQTPPSLPALPIQYVDYAQWQRHRFTGKFRDSQIKYWQEQLADATPVLNLPLDRPHTTEPTPQPHPPLPPPRRGTREGGYGGWVPFRFNTDLTQKLHILSKRSNTTLFITLFAAFSAFLSRYCNQDDIVVGTPIANRTPAITEALIGFFVNTLVLRTRPQLEHTFLELLSQVRQVALDAYAHADVPFDLLVEQLKPERLPGVSPLFQVMFTLQNVPKETLELSGLTVNPKPLDKPTAGATFDLTLSLTQSNTELIGAFEYNANLFDGATIERMARNFHIFVEGIVLNPEQTIAQLPILSAAERQQLLVEWNQTQTDYPRNACVHQLFEAQVQKTPDAVAVVLADQTLTYQELNHKANQLARYLQSLGVGSESLVGVCLERSPNLIIALLAILKAGGAYLPLETTYPPERLAFMVENAGLQVILTETGVRENLPEVAYSIDIGSGMINRRDAEDAEKEGREGRVTAKSLAYVMYTSGSTGQPKGVGVTHRNIVRLVKNTNYAQFTSNDVFLQLASVSFDAATWEIWGSLLNGSRLVLFPEPKPSLETLGQVIGQHQVTALCLTAGLFHLMVDERLEDWQSLRILMAGGDVLSVSHVQKCCQTLPHCQFINGYGPTENTTFTCCYPVPTGASFGQSIPIGRPIANTRVYILDGQHQPVPIGVTGELYLGGDGVARGYLNRPELNAERFIASPFLEGEILYKTGDLVRYLPDGNIEFLGRIDNQVKIRGFRIELSE
ncbi:MAG: amino acid adenylation domain-containing protein, partial [Prochloron sp. SP5CPC1]|nr:amino acid adenylation domain-containing protein [Candidatus Paraprochloron terpiosi SP5CPC1]